MKVVSVFGSPRDTGNTATVLGLVEEELRSQGHEVDRVNVTDYQIGGCAECFACRQTTTEPGCALKDDAPGILERMLTADAIIYATPLFCWSWSGQIKPFIDRHICLVSEAFTENWSSLVGGKRIALLATAAGPVEGNADLLIKQFDGMAEYLKAGATSKLVVPGCTSPNSLPASTQDQAVKLAHDLTS